MESSSWPEEGRAFHGPKLLVRGVFAALWRRGPKLLTGPHIVAFAGVEEIFVAG